MGTTNFPNGIKAPIYGSDGTRVSAITGLTDNSGGTGTDTLAVVGATYSQAVVANNFATVADKIEEILTALEAAQIIES